MLKIIVNNIELPLVQNSLTISKENNEFKSGFSISQTTRPLYILLTEVTEAALGKMSLFSSTPSVFPNITVIEDNIYYQGTLTIYNSFNGKIKADVKYTNVLLKHLENNIHTYFNAVAVDNGTTTDYVEESTDFSDDFWIGFVQNTIPRSFPEVDFNFPTVHFPTQKSGDDDWKNSADYINRKQLDNVLLNDAVFGNRNVIQPFYYLLSPLYRLFKNNLGYTLNGSFVEDEINQKRLLEPQADNLVKVTIDEETVYKHHLTIHPERYLPDWSVADYLNNLINQFNLKVIVNDITKTVTINYCQDHYFKNTPLVLKDLKFTQNVPLEFSSTSNYILKDASGTDVVNYSLEEITENDTEDENTTVITTAFKAAPAMLTQEWTDYDGIGIFLYNYATDNTNALTEYNGETNYLSGTKGIAAKHWYSWLKFRLMAKTQTIKLAATKKLKHDIENASSLYLKNQKFLLKSIKIKIEDVKTYLLELELLSNHF